MGGPSMGSDRRPSLTLLLPALSQGRVGEDFRNTHPLPSLMVPRGAGNRLPRNTGTPTLTTLIVHRGVTKYTDFCFLK